MKIVDIKYLQLTGSGRTSPDPGRGVAALDVYEEFGAKARKASVPKDDVQKIESLFLKVVTDSGLEGIHGPIDLEQVFVIEKTFRKFLIGRDPMPANLVWDQMYRLERHGRSGLIMMSLSAVDNALWDIRGKYYQVPVHKLLGGPTREKIPVYASSYPDLENADIQIRVKALKEEGFKFQKWFFRYGPGEGRKGVEKNAEMAAMVRQAAGNDTEIMFDCRRAWDVPFTLQVFQEIEQYRPLWIEEPLMANDLDGHRLLKKHSRVPIATGEHIYTRWEAKPYCDEHLADYLQVDPEWCGGITELVKIVNMAEPSAIKVVPHGRLIGPALQVVSAMPPGICPLVEFIVKGHQPRMQHFNKHKAFPENGFMAVPEEPGLGTDFDMEKVERIEEISF